MINRVQKLEHYSSTVSGDIERLGNTGLKADGLDGGLFFGRQTKFYER
jgi:hypothetical protein